MNLTRSAKLRLWKAFTAVVIFCIAAETIWVLFAASIGERSHFNFDHALLTPIYSLMGVFAVILTAASSQYAWGIHRHGTIASPILKSGVVWGLALTLPLTVLTAMWLSSGAGHHVQPGTIADILANGPGPGTRANPLAGTLGSDLGGSLLFGWSRTGGDLRVSHFFATHALHAVPIITFAIFALGWRSRWTAPVVAMGWTALVAFTFAQAMLGLPAFAWFP